MRAQVEEPGATDGAEVADEDPLDPSEVALTRILRIVGASAPAGCLGFLILVTGARDTPTTGALALLLVFALGFPMATFALVLAPARAVWEDEERARQMTWLAALAAFPLAVLGAFVTLVLLAAVDLL